METFLTTLKAVIDSLGATVVLPIIIFILGLILGAKPGKAFRAGLDRRDRRISGFPDKVTACGSYIS